jgi:hypothetical protein
MTYIFYTVLQFAITYGALMAGWYALRMAVEKLKR